MDCVHILISSLLSYCKFSNHIWRGNWSLRTTMKQHSEKITYNSFIDLLLLNCLVKNHIIKKFQWNKEKKSFFPNQTLDSKRTWMCVILHYRPWKMHQRIRKWLETKSRIKEIAEKKKPYLHSITWRVKEKNPQWLSTTVNRKRAP